MRYEQPLQFPASQSQVFCPYLSVFICDYLWLNTSLPARRYQQEKPRKVRFKMAKGGAGHGQCPSAGGENPCVGVRGCLGYEVDPEIRPVELCLPARSAIDGRCGSPAVADQCDVSVRAISVYRLASRCVRWGFRDDCGFSWRFDRAAPVQPVGAAGSAWHRDAADFTGDAGFGPFC